MPANEAKKMALAMQKRQLWFWGSIQSHCEWLWHIYFLFGFFSGMCDNFARIRKPVYNHSKSKNTFRPQNDAFDTINYFLIQWSICCCLFFMCHLPFAMSKQIDIDLNANVFASKTIKYFVNVVDNLQLHADYNRYSWTIQFVFTAQMPITQDKHTKQMCCCSCLAFIH